MHFSDENILEYLEEEIRSEKKLVRSKNKIAFVDRVPKGLNLAKNFI